MVGYLEESVDLTKLLVGAHEFWSGTLTRPTYLEYVEKIGKREKGEKAAGKTVDVTSGGQRMTVLTRRRSRTMKPRDGGVGDEELPNSPKRI